MKLMILTVTHENEEEGRKTERQFHNFIVEHITNILKAELKQDTFVSAKLELEEPEEPRI